MSDNNTGTTVVRKKYSPQFKDQALERAAKTAFPRLRKILVLKNPCYIHGGHNRSKVVTQLRIKNYSKQKFPD